MIVYFYGATALILIAAFVIRSFYDIRYPYRGKDMTIGREQVHMNVFGACSILGFIALHWFLDDLYMGLSPLSDMVVRVAGVCMAIAATVMMTWPRLQKGRREFWGGPKVEPEWFVSHELTTTGAYRYIRHPYYFGTMLSMLAIGLTAASYLVFVVPVLCFVVMRRSAIAEDELLSNTYGVKHARYRERTWRLIPLIY